MNFTFTFTFKDSNSHSHLLFNLFCLIIRLTALYNVVMKSRQNTVLTSKQLCTLLTIQRCYCWLIALRNVLLALNLKAAALAMALASLPRHSHNGRCNGLHD